MRRLLPTVIVACLVVAGVICPCVEAAGTLAASAEVQDAAHHASHHAGSPGATDIEPDGPAGVDSEHCCDLPAVVSASPDDDADEPAATLNAPWLDASLQPDASARLPEMPPGRPPDSPVALRDRLLE